MATLTLTCIADDRAGLVSQLSSPIRAHGASWTRSQMARLGGKFAGILLVDVPDAQAGALIDALNALTDQGLQVTVERTDVAPPEASERVVLELIGADRPGIVAEISATLAEAGVSIDELATDVSEAPMAGGHLFEARAILAAPAGSRLDDLRARLEALADELMVEINLSDE